MAPRRTPAAAVIARLAVVALLVAGFAGCTNDDGATPEPIDAPAMPEVSAPYDVGWVPDGFEVSSRGWGTSQVWWGQETEGSTAPITLLRRRSGGHPIVLATASYRGMPGYARDLLMGRFESIEPTEVGGRPALGGEGTVSELVVDHDDSTALHAWGRGATIEELEAAAAGARPGDRRAAPVVSAAPRGFEVAGQATVAAAAAVESVVRDGRQRLGDHLARSVTYREPNGSVLAVGTLPASAGDLAAVVRTSTRREIQGREREPVEVAGRAGWFLDGSTVVTTSADGDLVFVSSFDVEVVDLVRVAASVEAIDEEAWDDLVRQDHGGGPWTISGESVESLDELPAPDRTTSSPFVVRQVPWGYRLSGLGAGTRNPFVVGTTVLRRRGSTGADGLVRVSADRPDVSVDLDRYSSWMEPVTVQGWPAMLDEGVFQTDVVHLNDPVEAFGSTLVVAVEDQEVTVSGGEQEGDALDVAAGLDLDGVDAPNPPSATSTGRFLALGHRSAAVASAMMAPDGTGGLSVEWASHHHTTFRTSSDDVLAVWTFPADEVDVAAADGFGDSASGAVGEHGELDGRRAWWSRAGDQLLVETAWGDVLWVAATRPLGREVLDAVARSVEPVDAAGWTAYGGLVPGR